MRTAEDKQMQILDYIRRAIEEKGYPPSVREIGAAVGLRSTSTVHAHLETLERKGFIRRDGGRTRAMDVIDDSLTRSRGVPLVGRVAAGTPILAKENIEDYLVMPHSLSDPQELFALRVQGQSMIEAGILDGDIIIVRRTESVENGEIAVAMIEGEATVKRVFFEEEGIRLQPENSTMQPIFTDCASILGKVVALWRQF